MKILLILLVLCFSQCNIGPVEGTINEKTYEPERIYYDYDIALFATTGVMIDEKEIDDADYVFIIQPDNCTTNYRVEVDSITYNKFNVGDHIKI